MEGMEEVEVDGVELESNADAGGEAEEFKSNIDSDLEGDYDTKDL